MVRTTTAIFSLSPPTTAANVQHIFSYQRVPPDSGDTNLPIMTPPVTVTVTGAAGQIGYALLFRVASGQLLGPDVPIRPRLLEINPALEAREGIAMDLAHSAFPLLSGIDITDALATAFNGTNVALLVGARPRTAGMERGDLLDANGGGVALQ